MNADCFQKFVNNTLQRWEFICSKDNCNYNVSKNDDNKNAFDNVKNRLFIFDFATVSQIDVAGFTALKLCIEKILNEKHAKSIYFVNTRGNFYL